MSHEPDPCPYGDTFCPCQDGDPCHYEDQTASPAMTTAVTSCPHGIYHHGCPSCDRQDPEERL